MFLAVHGQLRLQFWTRIGAMNQRSAVRCPRFSVFAPHDTLKGGHRTLRFMESQWKTSNIEHPTSNIECRGSEPSRVLWMFGVGGSMLNVPGGSWAASTSNFGRA